MAELALKIGGTATYEDGDIVDAFNRRRIRHVHAQHICHVKHGRSELSEVYRAKTRQFLFQRVSKLEVVRTNLLTLAGEILSDKPNAYGEYIDVPLFIARRLKHPRHGIFGPPGVERWYGGTTTATHAILDDVWAEIESRTENREQDFSRMDLSDEILREFLVLPTDDFTDIEQEEYKAPLLDAEGEVAKKRKHRIDWQRDIGLSVNEKADVANKATRVDWRKEKAPFQPATIIQAKSLDAVAIS